MFDPGAPRAREDTDALASFESSWATLDHGNRRPVVKSHEDLFPIPGGRIVLDCVAGKPAADRAENRGRGAAGAVADRVAEQAADRAPSDRSYYRTSLRR